MSTGASDQAQLRARGIQSYGIGPASTEQDELNFPAHGDVERLARVTGIALAYLDRSERETHGCLSAAVKQLDAPRSAKIIWLKDKVPGRDAVKVRSLQYK